MMSTTTPRRQFLKWAGRIMAAFTLPMGCSLPSQGKADKTITSLTLPPKNPILSTTQAMNSPPHTPQTALEEKIGQMLMVGFRGLTVDSNHPIIEDLQHHHLGGVILFDYDVALKKPRRNIQSPSQVKKLVEQLQHFAHKPLLIAIDYEGGMINRLGEQLGFPKTVSFAYLGQVNDLNVTRQHAMEMAHTLAQLGINLNIAPVVDLALNAHNPIIARHQRSFSAQAEIVTRHALEFIKAHHRYGILA
ncbi:MAG: glycoside hydrolase family 3 N-terminal domain-containing protein, partial [Pseudomonadota bacterium]|nr:glycoside hydrolase family 3 N-terminal domain-containing protein [Pseudomonadota bacterium]